MKGGYESRKNAAELAMKLAEMDGGSSNTFWGHLHRLHGYLDHGVRHMKISGQEKAGKEQEADREMQKRREEELRKVQQQQARPKKQSDPLKPSGRYKPVSGNEVSGKIDEIKKRYPEKYPDSDLSSRDDNQTKLRDGDVENIRRELFLTTCVENYYDDNRTWLEKRKFREKVEGLKCVIDYKNESITVVGESASQKIKSLLIGGRDVVENEYLDKRFNAKVKKAAESVFGEDFSNFKVREEAYVFEETKDKSEKEASKKDNESKALQVARQKLFLTSIVERTYDEDRTRVIKRKFRVNDPSRSQDLMCVIDYEQKKIKVDAFVKGQIRDALIEEDPTYEDYKNDDEYMRGLLNAVIVEAARQVLSENFNNFNIEYTFQV